SSPLISPRIHPPPDVVCYSDHRLESMIDWDPSLNIVIDLNIDGARTGSDHVTLVLHERNLQCPNESRFGKAGLNASEEHAILLINTEPVILATSIAVLNMTDNALRSHYKRVRKN
ncbi:hypothetical protein DPMN_124267, partial [Dreissena polymorpha]